jgi:DNA-binding response OmpR family regulator
LPVGPQTLGQLRILRVGNVELHIDGHRLIVRGQPVHVTHKELVILHRLMDNAGWVITHRDLLDHAWGSDRTNCGSCHLQVHIRHRRKKIESARRPTRIRTVRGIGYIFDLPYGD